MSINRALLAVGDEVLVLYHRTFERAKILKIKNASFRGTLYLLLFKYGNSYRREWTVYEDIFPVSFRIGGASVE